MEDPGASNVFVRTVCRCVRVNSG